MLFKAFSKNQRTIMYRYQKHIASSILAVFTTICVAQERDQKKDTLDTQVVNVVKPYSPKISDAFKIKELPTINDEETTSRKEIRYNIFLVQVSQKTAKSYLEIHKHVH